MLNILSHQKFWVASLKSNLANLHCALPHKRTYLFHIKLLQIWRKKESCHDINTMHMCLYVEILHHFFVIIIVVIGSRRECDKISGPLPPLTQMVFPARVRKSGSHHGDHPPNHHQCKHKLKHFCLSSDKKRFTYWSKSSLPSWKSPSCHLKIKLD